MNFRFFASLTRAEAQQFLVDFLSTETKALRPFLWRASQDGIHCDFTFTSIGQLLGWAFTQVVTVRREPDDLLPAWITETSSYNRSLFDVAEESKPLLLRGSYYLGQTFVVQCPRLRWAVGDRSTTEQNMPVIAGFLSGSELAPLLVTENLFLRFRADGQPPTIIDDAVACWRQDLPS